MLPDETRVRGGKQAGNIARQGAIRHYQHYQDAAGLPFKAHKLPVETMCALNQPGVMGTIPVTGKAEAADRPSPRAVGSRGVIYLHDS